MKKIIILLGILLLFYACQMKSKPNSKNHFTLEDINKSNIEVNK